MHYFKTREECVCEMERMGLVTDNGKTWYYPGRYVLSHGEYSSPDYRPRKYKKGYQIHIKYYYYAGTLNAPDSGPMSEDMFLALQN